MLIACASATPIQTTDLLETATSPATSPGAPDGATLVQQRCTVCHTMARIQSAHHSAADWQTIVDSMIRRGAQLTAEEETIVVDYLAATYGP